MMEPARPPGPRPLPNPPTSSRPSAEAQWYEVEERNRPSYIVAPRASNAPWQQQYQPPPAHLPPLSPSARYQNQGGPYPSQQQPQQYFQQSQQGQRLPPGAANPYQHGQQPQQPQQQQQRSWAASNEPIFANSGVARGKGSAFMHKGFFDIMSLVNNRDAPANSRLMPPGGYKDRQINSSPSRIRTTLSKATGGLRKMSLGAGAGEPFFAGPGAPTSVPPAATLEPPRPLGLTPTRDSMDSTYQHSIASASSAAVLGGPRAAKKRISVDMVGAPRPESFVHAAHASDADQAEAILQRWSRDGVGKIADPRWVEPIKEAMRMQAARNQAEAIAQVQAALHQDSMIRENPRPLHVMNGAASPSQLTVTSTINSGTGTLATIGHGSIMPPSNAIFQGIREETRGSDGEARDSPFSDLPANTRAAPTAGRPIPPAFPRTNTGGTMVINPTPDGQTRAAPDYMAYKPADTGGDATRPLSGVPPQMAVSDKRESKAIDGLPGSGVPAGIGAMFDPPMTPASARPESMLVRDTIQSYATGLTPTLATSTTAPIDGAQDSEEALIVLGAAVRPSLTTVEKSVAAKIYFENLYYGILKKPRARDTRRAGLEAELNVLRISDGAKEAIRQAWAANETEHLRDLRARVNVNSFHRLKTIGHGAFGVVALVRERGSGELFAMKQLRKADMLRKGQEGHVRAERDLMTSASASANAKWIVKLVYSFQDVDHLYLIMEFMGGGDLLNLLIEKDIFAEDFAKFYVAEMILSIHEAHRLGYIHRDIKPDNFLFTSQGHVKLADFGLCQSFHWAHDGAYYDQQRKNLLRKHGIDLDDSPAGRRGGPGGARIGGGAKAQGNPGAALSDKELADVLSDRNEDGTPMTHVLTWRDKNKKKMAFSVVGTNNYMAPEVLRGLGYDQSCDWWSLGVIVFEMLYGYPPFVSKSRHLTRQKILNWRQTLRFPPKPKVSREAQDFIQRLVCEKDDRLGSTSTASVSRPNSIIQGARRSGFLPGQGSAGGLGGSAGLIDGVDDLMAHPWFRGVDWGNIHSQTAPFKPALSHPADTKHFEDDIDDEPLPAPGAAEAGPNAPAEQARDPMLRDKAHGEHLLEMRKQLAFVGYTFKSPKHFDPRTQLDERNVAAAEAAQAHARAYGARQQQQQQQDLQGWNREPTEGGSRVRSMSM